MLVKPIAESISDGLLYLRLLTPSDVTDRYIGWLNDPDVNRWLETRWEKQTAESVSGYVNAHLRTDHGPKLYGIFIQGAHKHIGNIRLGLPHPNHSCADVAYFIGEKTEWSKGFATRAVALLCNAAFNVLGIHRVQAGCYAANKASARVLLKAGFAREGERVRSLKTENGWDNELLFGRLAGGSAL